MGEDEPSIVGRRVSDGNYLSIREAVHMFATKDELASMRSSISSMSDRIGTFVTRTEHEARWTRDDEFRREVKVSLDDLKAQRLPQWALTIALALLSIVIAAWSHMK